MIKTPGITDIALPVKEVKRSFAFYEKIFGAIKMYHDPEFVQVHTAGSKKIVFIKKTRSSIKKSRFSFWSQVVKAVCNEYHYQNN